MKSNPTIVHVDAFSDKAFGGNPAAVCLLSEARQDRWMQDVAQEMNLSETAFLHKQGDGFSLRWFTPKVEVDLCGHATLASAHALWEEGRLRPDEQARFYTRSGLLTAQRKVGLIELDFPARAQEQASSVPDLVEALGVAPIYIGKTHGQYLVEVESEDIVKNLQPNFALLGTIPMNGVMVTSLSISKEYDFVSRYFAPAEGIPEDPVTGSAHCCLGPYWKAKLNKDEFIAYQASERGGILHVRVNGDRVYLSGKAITILRGELKEI
jgi:PhzF family phenazine biosynthesis protein